MYKVYDTRGYEVLFRATELTKQDIISVSELKELAKGFVIDDSPFQSCQKFQDCTNSNAKYPVGEDDYTNSILGKNNSATGRSSIAIGEDNLAEGDYSTSIGNNSSAAAIGFLALGLQAKANGVGSTSIGNTSSAIAKGSVALGMQSVAKGAGSIALGNIEVMENNVLGNIGAIYGKELYSNQLEVSGNPLTKQFLLDISNLNVYNSTTEQYYTISGNSISKNYFKSKMVAQNGGGPINAVNITQLVYTLVGAVKEQQTTIQDLTSRLNTLEST